MTQPMRWAFLSCCPFPASRRGTGGPGTVGSVAWGMVLCLTLGCVERAANPPAVRTGPRCDGIFGGLLDDATRWRGPWSLGTKSAASAELVPYVAFSLSEPGFAGSDGVAWWYTGGANWPSAFLNTNRKAISYADITMQPGQLVLHPGEKGEQSVVRSDLAQRGSRLRPSG